jgi:hypothetical protein
MKMNMTPVNSSNLAAVGFEKGTLYIRFHSGDTYAYFDVPRSVYEELMSAPSHGRYHSQNIKYGYRYKKL